MSGMHSWGCCPLARQMNYFHFSLPWVRCCSSLLCGLHQGELGRVGRAGIGLVLSRGHWCCLSVGTHQQYLGMLCWLCHLQVLLHASHHHHNVSSLSFNPNFFPAVVGVGFSKEVLSVDEVNYSPPDRNCQEVLTVWFLSVRH